MKIASVVWRLTVILQCVVLLKGESATIQKTEITEVRVGDSTYLRCITSKSTVEISWYHFPVGREIKYPNYVSVRGLLYPPYDKRFQIQAETTSIILVINDAMLEDAGLYICQNEESEQMATEQLIVLNSVPVCQNNVNANGFIGPNSCHHAPEKIRLSCSVDYKGNVPPKLHLSRAKHNNENTISDTLTDCNATEGSIRCKYSTLADSEFDGSHLICQTKGSKHAQYNCSTHIVKVFYAVDEMTPMASFIGETVNCFVKTNSPVCNFTWISTGGGNVSGGGTTLVSNLQALTISTEGWHKCEASCSIKGFQCKFDAGIVKASKDNTNVSEKHGQESLVIIVLLGSFLFACFLVWMFLAIRFLIKKQARKAKENCNTLGQNQSMQDWRLLTIAPILTKICQHLRIGEAILENISILENLGERYLSKNEAPDKFRDLLSNWIVQRVYEDVKKAILGKRPKLAEFLNEGEVVKLRLTTNHDGLNARLSAKLDEAIDGASELLFPLTKCKFYPIVATDEHHGIEIFIYFPNVKIMEDFMEAIDSKQMEQRFSSILNAILPEIEPNSTKYISTSLSLDEKEFLRAGTKERYRDEVETNYISKYPNEKKTRELIPLQQQPSESDYDSYG